MTTISCTLRITIICCLLCLGVRALGQHPIKEGLAIKGTVIDSTTKAGLDFVTVALRTEKGQHLKTDVTTKTGAFTFKGLAAGRYQLSVASIGYEPKKVDVTLAGRDQDLKSLHLRRSSNQLKEVVVKGDKPVVRQEIDRLSYDLQADPESKSSNVLEMMRKVPMLSVDGEDNILLKGDRNYKILINGKPSSMMERNPKDILKSMPASSIQRIEVITTPPAKYDGEGLAGIINIITNKKADNGYSGSWNVNGRFPAAGPGTGGAFTMKSGKFGLSLNAGGNLSDVPSLEHLQFRESYGDDPTSLRQSVTRQSEGRNGYLNTEVSFELDSLNLISGQVNVNGNRGDRLDEDRSITRNYSDILQQYALTNTQASRGRGTDVALNYQRGFKSARNRLLTFSYRYYGFRNSSFDAIGLTEVVNYALPDYHQSNTGRFSEHTIQADYVQPLKKISIEGGVKAIFRLNKSDFSYSPYIPQDDAFVEDAARSNTFSNSQDIYSIYNTYQYSAGDWGIKAGARIEATVINANFSSAGLELHRQYFNIIPSISVNRKFSKSSSLNLGYTSRIQRPNIEILNPFVDRSSPNFESTGNPDLKTGKVQMFQLGYSNFKKASINVGLMLNFFDDLVMPLSTYDSETNITRTTYGNTGKATLLGFNMNLSYPITKEWRYSANCNIAYGWVEGIVNGRSTSNRGLMPYVYSSTDYKFEKGWRLAASVSYYGRSISLQRNWRGVVGSALTVSREVMKDKLTFSVTGNNPFTKFRQAHTVTRGYDFLQTSNNRSYFRSFSASLDYRFGKLKDGIARSKRSIRNDDAAGAPN